MKFKIKVTDVFQTDGITLIVGEVNNYNYFGKIRNGNLTLDVVGNSAFEIDMKNYTLLIKEKVNKEDVIGKMFSEI